MIQGQEPELKQLIETIKGYELEKVDIQELCSPCPTISITHFLEFLRQIVAGDDKYFILDVRSESEFKDSHIPLAFNLPLFSDIQRHNVGLLFKQQSQTLAEQIGLFYAREKQKHYLKTIREKAGNRKILVHCWRGGYRSQAITALLINHGFNAVQLEGGIKAFRRTVHHFLYEYELDLVALSGKTGVGKSEVIEAMQKENSLPTLHLEEAARHASSVFGPARFGHKPINKQSEFETRLFMQLLPWIQNEKLPLIITEKESPKIGRLTLPPSIHKALNLEKHILLTCPLKQRVDRLKREYISSCTPEQMHSLRERITFLKRLISNEQLKDFLLLFDEKKWDELLEKILIEYYDRVYKKTAKPPLTTVEHLSIEHTIFSIKEIIKKGI